MGDANLEPPTPFWRRRKDTPVEAGSEPLIEPAREALTVPQGREPTPLLAEEAPVTPKALAPEPPDLHREGSAGTRHRALPWVVVGLTGALVGLLLVGLTVGSLRVCEGVQGTSSCGSGPGLVLLVAILAISVSAGGLLLKLCGVEDPVSTSFLAVGLVAVLVLLFLLSFVESWQMALVVPALGAAMFALSHWVTTAVAAEVE